MSTSAFFGKLNKLEKMSTLWCRSWPEPSPTTPVGILVFSGGFKIDWCLVYLGLGAVHVLKKKHTHVSQHMSENCMILYDSVMCCSRKSTGNILEYQVDILMVSIPFSSLLVLGCSIRCTLDLHIGISQLWNDVKTCFSLPFSGAVQLEVFSHRMYILLLVRRVDPFLWSEYTGGALKAPFLPKQR